MCGPDTRAGEEVLAQLIKCDLGVDINPQALRMFIRSRWDQIAPMAHRIHGRTDAPIIDAAIDAARNRYEAIEKLRRERGA